MLNQRPAAGRSPSAERCRPDDVASEPAGPGRGVGREAGPWGRAGPRKTFDRSPAPRPGAGGRWVPPGRANPAGLAGLGFSGPAGLAPRWVGPEPDGSFTMKAINRRGGSSPPQSNRLLRSLEPKLQTPDTELSPPPGPESPNPFRNSRWQPPFTGSPETVDRLRKSRFSTPLRRETRRASVWPGGRRISSSVDWQKRLPGEEFEANAARQPRNRSPQKRLGISGQVTARGPGRGFHNCVESPTVLTVASCRRSRVTLPTGPPR